LEKAHPLNSFEFYYKPKLFEDELMRQKYIKKRNISIFTSSQTRKTLFWSPLIGYFRTDSLSFKNRLSMAGVTYKKVYIR